MIGTQSGNSCASFPKLFLMIGETRQTKALYREYYGYFTDGEDVSFGNENINLKCKDFNSEIETNYLQFSNEDKEIFSSNNHCFYYYEQSVDDNKIVASKEKCEEGKFTKYATVANLRCAYVDISFNSKNGNSKNYKTCFPFLSEDIKSGKLNEFTKYNLDEIFTKEFPGESDINYTIKITAGDDVSAIYNTETGKMIDENAHEDEHGSGYSYSYIITIPKFLIILFLIIF